MDEKENTRELVVVDVKRYKKVKAALKDSEERYRQLFENVPIGIYRTTPDGRIIDANPALIKMLGYDSFAGLSSRKLEDDYADPGFSRSAFIKRLKHDGEIIGLETIWIKKDGSAIHVRENARLIRDQVDQVFFEGTVEDITQSRRAEEDRKIRTRQLEILNRIICLGNQAESMTEMLEMILECVIETLAFDTAGVYMVDPDAKKVNLVARRGAPSHFYLMKKYMAIDRMPFSQVLGLGQPVFVDNVHKVLPDLEKKWKWKMACSIPLVSKGLIVGAMNVASCERAVFSPEEKNILELIGKEAGTLISKLQTETALRESERYYRTLIDTSPEIIVVLGLDGRLQMVNQQFLKTGGYFYDEVIGASAFDFVAGLERLFLEKKTAAFIKKKKISGSEYLFKKKDGRAVPLEVSASLLTDALGRPKGIIAFGRDVSEHKQAEEALRESEEKFRSITEHTSDLIAITDAGGVITYASSSGRALFLYTPDEMCGRHFSDFLDPSSIAKARAAFRTTLDSGIRTINLELAMKRKDGSLFIGEVNGSNFHYGDQYGSMVFIRDISQRKRDEEQLRFLSSITENTSDAVIVTNADFAITYINKVAEKFFGYTLEELKGKSPGIFNAEPLAAQIQKRLYRIVASGENYLGESLNRRKDGSTFYCEYKVTPLKDTDGKIYAYASVQRDISERKHNEAVLSRSEDTFRRTFEAIPDPAYVWTRQDDGRVLLSLYNQAAVLITRGGIKNFLGIEAKKLFAGQPEFVTKINRTIEKGQQPSSEVLYRFQSTAESKWLQVDYVKTAEKSVMVITKDISERKEAEARLLAYQEQLRALTSEMVLVEERERRRIAAELHDQIGQNLALCMLKVAALEKIPGHDAMKEELVVVHRLLECSIQDARSLIFDLSPPVLYELGFAAALEWLAERMQEQFHIPVECESRLRVPELQNDQQVILFQVVRELLMNVGKHSRASRAKLILAREGPLLKIQVNDDGVGFDTAKVFAPKEQGSGFGFFSVRERLNYVGGRLEIKSKPGQGSQIILTVPLLKKENS